MELKFKKNSFILRLEYNNSLLYEICSSDIHEDITIGRDSSCTWLLPTEDRFASSHHAVITVKRSGIFIEDAKSRNGIYFNGEKITSRRLVIGDQISIGECKLFVEKANDVPNAVNVNNQLELLNGSQKGKICDLDKELFRIGSSSECDLVFNDNVVSHVHAQIEQKSDGSCWIKDCGSRNGTKVNNVSLSTDRNDSGRMLQDGDIITISYLELRYLDKHVVHVRSHLAAKIIAVVVTLGIVLGGFFLIRGVSPSAKRHIDVARFYAANHQFEKAREHLEKAGNARGADTHAWERGELAKQIKQWENTILRWRQVQELLLKKRWIDANKILSPLFSENMELWRWNDTDANEAKILAVSCKRLIDAFLEARTTMEDANATLERIDNSLENLGSVLETMPTQAPPFLKLLQKFARDIHNELTLLKAEQTKIIGIISDKKQVERLEFAIEELKKIEQAAVARAEKRRLRRQRYARKTQKVCKELLLPLALLLNAQNVLDKNYEAAAAFKFDTLTKRLPLPTPAQCSSSPFLADKRRELELCNEECLNNANQLKNMISTLRSYQLEPGQVPAYIRNICSKSAMAKVLACDTLNLPVVKWNRTAPSGVYDRVLGVEVFYEYMRALPEQFDSGLLDGRGFTPELFRARTAFVYLDDFLTFSAKREMEKIRNVKSRSNKLAEYIEYADELLLRREDIVSNAKKQYAQQTGRQAVICGGIMLLLGSNTKMLPKNFSEEVAAKFRNLRREMQAIGSRETTPEKAIQEKQQLLKTGLPGDPLLKQPWAERKR